MLSREVPWKWKVVVDSESNPILSEFPHLGPVIVPGRSRWRRGTFSIARHSREVDLVFGMAYFVPWSGPPAVANFFDSNIYEHFGTWVASGKLANALLLRVLSDWSVLRSRKLFVLSEYCAKYLTRRFPSASGKFVVTPPGCPSPRHCLASYRPQSSSFPSRPFLLYVGTFSENKNQRRLVEAYVRLQRSGLDLPPLVLIGPCDRPFHEKAIRPAIQQSPDPSRIHLPGRVSDDDLAWAYANALAYVQPSIAEGFGLPVVEAMSHGLPVACSDTTSLPETAGGAALLFQPTDCDSIAGALQRISSDEPLRRRLIDQGAKRWRDFTWQRNVDKVLEEIGTLLATPRSGIRP